MRKTVWLLINYKHEKIRVEEVLEDLSWSPFFSFEKTFFKTCNIIVSENSIFFQPIIAQNYDSYVHDNSAYNLERETWNWK